jgi:quaternary ammonium compound-resistance protein SugE
MLAGLLEVSWAAGLKYAEGWTKLCPKVPTVGVLILSFYTLSLAL